MCWEPRRAALMSSVAGQAELSRGSVARGRTGGLSASLRAAGRSPAGSAGTTPGSHRSPVGRSAEQGDAQTLIIQDKQPRPSHDHEFATWAHFLQIPQFPRRGIGEDLLTARRAQRVGLPVQIL